MVAILSAAYVDCVLQAGPEFGAIAAGRNRLVLGEIGWIPPVVGLIAWAALLHFHRAIFGVAPVLMG